MSKAKRMSTSDYNEMLHFAPQHADESRFARDYRAQSIEEPAPRRMMIIEVIITALNVVALLAMGWVTWFVFAVVM